MPAQTRAAGVLVTAYNEADRLGATLAALSGAFPAALLVVADDASTDSTAAVAAAAGAEVVRSPRRVGKGGAATLGARRVLDAVPAGAMVTLCDGDLGLSAGGLTALGGAVEEGAGDLAVAVFARREGGGLGLALSLARLTIRARSGLEPAAPISGQRALRAGSLAKLLPFAPGFGMETAMTVDAQRTGLRLVEVELPLEHRATGRTAAGFAHRGRQLVDIARVYASRR